MDLKVNELLGLEGCGQQHNGQLEASYYLEHPKGTGTNAV